ncbi:hypothetical protein DRN43_02340 [Thermococci archaeon]|nr:MAG: hypothetical protein DRJ03_12555 [Chloroflexota bacterium]RLF90156.1 MAG: hypothetical protein DRN43_02340 [Thermococci archaeon]
MESVVKEVLGELQREYSKPLKVLKIVEEDNTTYIITSRRTKADEGLKIALPILLEGIANTWNLHLLGVTKGGVVYLAEINEEDVGLIYCDQTIPLDLPIKEEEVSRYTFFGLMVDEVREAYIIPKDLLLEEGNKWGKGLEK